MTNTRRLLIALATALAAGGAALPAVAERSPYGKATTVVSDVLLFDGRDGPGGGNDERLLTLATPGGVDSTCAVVYIDTDNSGTLTTRGKLALRDTVLSDGCGL